ncbi:HAD hydrolase, family IIA [Teladorsagia circumcincta]|uniref:HAD hydrolase, family IIA n=1 Tax=Teladorsagia circumcincta TaxID=45464 RepID=A0A2G9V3V7_TELCI|nr:HAD hydrolase, family IIA [Teladorsagia circumcincta]
MILTYHFPHRRNDNIERSIKRRATVNREDHPQCAFKEECKRYAKQKRLSINNKSKLYNMTSSDENAEELTPDSFANLVQEFDTFICGADGLVWLREGVITEASSLLNLLINNKKQVIILTNDTTTTRGDHEKKLAQHRFSPKITKDVIVTPGQIVADYIKNAGNYYDKKVYLVASEGVEDELRNNGIEFFGQGPDTLQAGGIAKEAVVFNTDMAVKREEVCAVVVGFDKHFNYKKMMKAANYLKNPNCLFLATNNDATFPCQNQDIVVPDAGKAIATSLPSPSKEL